MSKDNFKSIKESIIKSGPVILLYFINHTLNQSIFLSKMVVRTRSEKITNLSFSSIFRYIGKENVKIMLMVQIVPKIKNNHPLNNKLNISGPISQLAVCISLRTNYFSAHLIYYQWVPPLGRLPYLLIHRSPCCGQQGSLGASLGRMASC
jgi:hypothetical protein